jgi:hypothetical protein
LLSTPGAAWVTVVIERRPASSALATGGSFTGATVMLAVSTPVVAPLADTGR